MSNEPGSLLATSIVSALIVCLAGAAVSDKLDVVPALLIAAAATLPEWAALVTNRGKRPVVGGEGDTLADSTVVLPVHDETSPTDPDSPPSEHPEHPEQADRDLDLTSDRAEVMAGPRSDSDDDRSLLIYLEVGRRSIAQCPVCGRHDVALASSGDRFECVVCETAWSRGVDAPWPRTIGNPTRSGGVAHSSTTSGLDVRDQAVKHQGALKK